MSVTDDLFNPRLADICNRFSHSEELVFLREAMKDFDASVSQYSAHCIHLKCFLGKDVGEERLAYFKCKLDKFESALYTDLAKLMMAVNMTQRALEEV